MDTYVQERKLRRRFLLGLILLTLLFILAVLNGSRRIQADLQQKAQLALREAGYDSSLLWVNGRDAILSGVTPSEDAKTSMLSLVDNVQGMRVVRDRLTVDASAFERSKLAVNIQDDSIYLAGTVSEEARDEILSAAQATYDNGNVESDLVVAEVQDNLPDVSQLLSQLSSVGARSFELEEGRLTLGGSVASEAEQLQLESLVRDAIGSDLSIVNALVVDETLNPGATGTVEGTVAPEAAANEAAEETVKAGTDEANLSADSNVADAETVPEPSTEAMAETTAETALESSDETANASDTSNGAEPVTTSQDTTEATESNIAGASAETDTADVTEAADESLEANATTESAVATDEALSEPDITITYGSGTVQLSGTVASEEVRQAVQAAFPDKTVTNALQLDDGVRASAWLPNLLDVSTRIEGNVLNPSLEVSGTDLVVRGTVSSEAMSTAVEGYLVDAVSPTLSVDNQLEIQDLIPFSEEGK